MHGSASPQYWRVDCGELSFQVLHSPRDPGPSPKGPTQAMPGATGMAIGSAIQSFQESKYLYQPVPLCQRLPRDATRKVATATSTPRESSSFLPSSSVLTAGATTTAAGSTSRTEESPERELRYQPMVVKLVTLVSC